MGFWSGFYSHSVVIGALILRETRTRFGQNYLGFLWAFLEPVFWIGTFFFIFAFLGRGVPAGMDVVSFITTGLLPFIMFRQNVDRMLGAVKGNKSLLFYPQVQIIDLILSRLLLEMGTLYAVFMVIMISRAMYFGDYMIASYLQVVLGLAAAALMGAGLGLVISMSSIFYDTIERLVGPIMRPLFFISGIFFTAQSVPSNFLKYLQYNPVFQIVELVRHGFFMSYTSPVLNYSYLFSVIIVLWLVGLTLERMARPRIELT